MNLAGVMVSGFLAAGCVTTESKPDGSTKVHVSLGSLTRGLNTAQSAPTSGQVAANPKTVPQPARSNAVSAADIRTTALGGIFKKYPYDGTPKSHFPRVAVTVTDWSRSDCWLGTATIWWSKSKSESVPGFFVCWSQSLGFAVNNAANLHLFMQQMAVEHSGNLRTIGPKPPMLAIPDRQPISESQQLAFQGFIQKLVLDTGWQPGAPTNIWLVGYDANAANKQPAPKPDKPTEKPVDAKAKLMLEQALSCASISPKFERAETMLEQAGWNRDQGVTPFKLTEPVKVFGHSVRKVGVHRDGCVQTYLSHIESIDLQQIAKAASLKLGKDRKTYGRVTKLGVLEARIEDGEVTLTCTVDTGG